MTAGVRLAYRITVAAVVLALALVIGTAAQGHTEPVVCWEDQTCWDGRTMGNRITGERWIGHNGADSWGPNRINWYVLVKWYGPGLLDRST